MFCDISSQFYLCQELAFIFFNARMKKKSTLVVGVTGGIGSGKSEVCKIFARLGAQVIRADDRAKDIMQANPKLKKTLVDTFGTDIYRDDGTLNRKRLAEIIFSDPKKRETIDALVHPFVIAEMKRSIRRARFPIVVIEAALIYESGVDTMMDYVVVVDADEEMRIRRALEHGKISRDEFLRRAKAQMPPKQKIARGDFVLQNNGDLVSLEKKAQFLFRLFLTMIRQNDLR